MPLSEVQENMGTLLTEAITVLCKNGLNYRDAFTIEGLLGITLDSEEVFLVKISQQIARGIVGASISGNNAVPTTAMTESNPEGEHTQCTTGRSDTAQEKGTQTAESNVCKRISSLGDSASNATGNVFS